MNILITRHDKIGDFCTTLPMFKALKEQTNHKVIALVSKVNYEFAKEIEFIDDVVLYHDNPFILAKNIKKMDIDVSISAFIEPKLGISLMLAGVKKRLAPATKIAQIFFNHKVKQRRSEVKMSEWEYNLQLLKELNSNLSLKFKRPLLSFDIQRENIVAFHPGFGGSSDGNLVLEDYLQLANSIKEKVTVIFTFGPADKEAKEFIKQNSNFEIRDDFGSLMEFTKFLASVKLFVSTSTGPMHLASLSDTPTLSFFGDTLFASDKRWKPVSTPSLQSNFLIPKEYDKKLYHDIELKLGELV